MNSPCTKCGTLLETSWSYCPKCGLGFTGPAPAQPEHAEHEKSSVPGAFGGLLFGVIAAPVLIIFGTLLCLTGLGAFLGVPMILAGIVAPLLGPVLGLGEHSVRCPWCHTREITVADGKVHYCPNCDKEFALGEHQQVAKAS
jgi:RNA polymerase subunit RPABC4/transcription elongation factor Spt4